MVQVDLQKFRDYVDLVRVAAENQNYKWRTISGIAKESGLAPEVVFAVVTTSTDTFVQSAIPSTTGEPLFTTRNHFLETATTTDKLLGAVKNRIS